MKRNWLMPLAAFAFCAGLVACGGSGESEPPPSSGSDPAREVGDGVPNQARADGQSFVAWLKTLVAQNDSQAQPLQIDGASGIPVDERAEPLSL